MLMVDAAAVGGLRGDTVAVRDLLSDDAVSVDLVVERNSTAIDFAGMVRRMLSTGLAICYGLAV